MHLCCKVKQACIQNRRFESIMAHPTALNRAQRTQLLEKMNSGICAPPSFSMRRHNPQEGQDKFGSKAVPERPQTRTESGHLPDLSGMMRIVHKTRMQLPPSPPEPSVLQT
ncbi:hypothetical protein WJX81_001432 [Elliptochloris bilobata]|uniref:Uncharacterized protein n=1 Tax=Elliptochloris bilobata TaxID=381761 RepID=A0AAW1QV13_9CHLO